MLTNGECFAKKWSVERGMWEQERATQGDECRSHWEGDSSAKPLRSKGVSHADILEKSFPGWENSQCKGPEARGCLTCSRKSKSFMWLEVVKGWDQQLVRAWAGSMVKTCLLLPETWGAGGWWDWTQIVKTSLSLVRCALGSIALDSGFLGFVLTLIQIAGPISGNS